MADEAADALPEMLELIAQGVVALLLGALHATPGRHNEVLPRPWFALRIQELIVEDKRAGTATQRVAALTSRHSCARLGPIT